MNSKNDNKPQLLTTEPKKTKQTTGTRTESQH